MKPCSKCYGRGYVGTTPRPEDSKDAIRPDEKYICPKCMGTVDREARMKFIKKMKEEKARKDAEKTHNAVKVYE
jgi:hypothetical protein